MSRDKRKIKKEPSFYKNIQKKNRIQKNERLSNNTPRKMKAKLPLTMSEGGMQFLDANEQPKKPSSQNSIPLNKQLIDIVQFNENAPLLAILDTFTSEQIQIKERLQLDMSSLQTGQTQHELIVRQTPEQLQLEMNSSQASNQTQHELIVRQTPEQLQLEMNSSQASKRIQGEDISACF